jgi:hypothetical protein
LIPLECRVAADAVLLGDMAARDSPDRFPGMKRSPPQIGPDVVKIGSTDGSITNSSCGGTSALAQRETGNKPMNATPSEKAESSAPEADTNLAAVSEVEAGIRDFVRNDIAYLRRPATGAPNIDAKLEPSTEATVNNVNSLIQRVAGTSLAEIENLVTELESLRDLLHAEGQRVQREISGYAQLSQAAMKSTRMIADNVAQWKRTAENLRND